MPHWHVLRMDVSFDEIVLLFCSCNLGGHSSQSQPRCQLCHLVTGLCVPPRVPLVTKLCVAWPGWRTLRLARAAQPRQPHPVTAPGSETSWEPGAGAVSGLLSLSLSPPTIPDTKPLWARARYPPPPGSPGSPRIFTFKSPIQRFAFKCFFSETQSPSDYLHTAGRNQGTDSQQLLKSERTFTHGSHNTDLRGVGPCLQYSLLRYARVSQYKW